MIDPSASPANPSFPAVRFDHACFGCGDANPIGLHLQFSPTSDGVTASFTPEPAHQGFDNVIHGGIISTILDEAMAWATTQAGIWAVTANMSVRFKNPIAVGEPATVTARVTENRGRIVSTAAELMRDFDKATIATATATFVRVSDTLATEWQRRYLENEDATEIANGSPGSSRQRVTKTRG
jgi:acyl-coenzyme A thioesterase PaaI-like protein